MSWMTRWMIIFDDCERMKRKRGEITIKIDFQYFYNKRNKNK